MQAIQFKPNQAQGVGRGGQFDIRYLEVAASHQAIGNRHLHQLHITGLAALDDDSRRVTIVLTAAAARNLVKIINEEIN